MSDERVRLFSFGVFSACDAFRLCCRHIGVLLYSQWCVAFRLSRRHKRCGGMVSVVNFPSTSSAALLAAVGLGGQWPFDYAGYKTMEV